MTDDVKPPTRREKARATRLRIIHAAHKLFSERGFGGTRMADVAADAGVAVQTVYFSFHTKGELLQACYEVAVLGEDDPRPPQLQPWYAEAMTAKRPDAAVRAFVRGNGEIASRVGVLDEVIRLTPYEPEAFAVHVNSEALRRAGFREVVASFAERFGLRGKLSVDAATDIFLTLGSGAVYRSLVLDQGWTHDAYVDWVTNVLLATVVSVG
jgi:AcrR family transcriptional regulator